MPNWDHIAGDLQIDAADRLANEPFFGDVVLLREDKGIIESDVAMALTVFNEETGKKIGAAVVVRLPVISDSNSEAPGPELSARLVFDVWTMPLINMDTLGTQKRADVIASRILNLLHRYYSAFTRCLLMPSKTPIAPLTDLPEGSVGYRVTLETTFILNNANKVATPDCAIVSGELVMTCATTGAAIWYTTDESYPGPENAEATEYTVPLTITERTVFRVGAVLADVLPSDTTWLVINLQTITTEAGEILTTEADEPITTETPEVE